MPERTVPLASFEGQMSEKAELSQDRESESPAGNQQFAELNAANEEIGSSLEETIDRKTEPPGTTEAALNALERRFSETVRSLKNQIRENENLLESREATLKALGKRVNQLNTQLAELQLAKNEDSRLFREELAQKGELLRLRDFALKNLEERFAKQIRVLECQLGDEQNLLEMRDRELNSLMGKVRELTQERADLASECEKSDGLIKEALREKAALLRANESSTRDVKEMTAKIQWCERELAQKQELLENSGTAVAELRRQIHVLTKRSREAAAAKLRAETLLHEERLRASQIHLAGDSSRKTYSNQPTGDQGAGPQPALSGDWNLSRSSRFRRMWQITSKPQTFPLTLLAVAVVGLLIIPIGYFLLGHGRAPTQSNPIASIGAVIAKASINEEERPATVGPTSPSSGLKSRKAVAVANRRRPPEHLITYKTRRAVAIREAPRFAATTKAQLAAGTSISVLEAKGDWFKVKTRPSGTVGYVRKEYLVRQPSHGAESEKLSKLGFETFTT
jgi:hypothetical protein